MNNKVLQKRIDSFKFAIKGIRTLISSEVNAKIHCTATICVVLAGFILGISKTEWIAVIFAIGLVISAEGFNSAIEKLCDEFSPNFNEKIGRIKDVAAGSVLLCATTAAIIGLIVFVPYLIAFF